MRARVAYRTFRTPNGGVGFYNLTVFGADLLGSGSNFNLLITQ